MTDSVTKITLNLPIGPDSRFYEILSAGMARTARDNPDVRLNPTTSHQGILAKLTDYPDEAKAGLAISFMFNLHEFFRGGRITGDEFNTLNIAFQEMLLVACPSIMTPQNGEAKSLYARMMHALYADLTEKQK